MQLLWGTVLREGKLSTDFRSQTGAVSVGHGPARGYAFDRLQEPDVPVLPFKIID